eukprot:m.181011 g.181011  ORF g.181011 m.181011 type:complete len:113 (-) comp14662_c1_seq6:2459-2797(-)
MQSLVTFFRPKDSSHTHAYMHIWSLNHRFYIEKQTQYDAIYLFTCFDVGVCVVFALIAQSSVIQVLCTIPSSPIGPPSNSTTTTTAVPATSQTAQFEFSTFPVSDIPPCLRP